jgi:hypothetical protein
VQVQGDIALMMRESESQQQLHKELQARECSMLFVLFQSVNPEPHLFQAQKEALEAALSGEGLRQLQAEIDSLRERGKAAGGNIMYDESFFYFRFLW